MGVSWGFAVIAVADPVKASTTEAVPALREDRLSLVMLTGDNRVTAEAIARRLGIPNFQAEILPDKKSEVVKELQSKGRVVAMSGIANALRLRKAKL